MYLNILSLHQEHNKNFLAIFLDSTTSLETLPWLDRDAKRHRANDRKNPMPMTF
jgi:hypothetical protein